MTISELSKILNQVLMTGREYHHKNAVDVICEYLKNPESEK